jgi:L-amino acid N-acyltransferase YncA
VTVRKGILADVSACTAIYNYWVEDGVATFDESPRSPLMGLQWFDAHRQHRYPLLVWELGQRIAGWGTLTAWSTNSGYDRSAEASVFIGPEDTEQGGGRLLLGSLVSGARELGHHTLIARIEVTNKTSLVLFKQAGFTPVGMMREIGFKNGRWLDVFMLERQV